GLDPGLEGVLGGDQGRLLHAEGAAHLGDHHVAHTERDLAVRRVQDPGAGAVAGDLDRHTVTPQVDGAAFHGAQEENLYAGESIPENRKRPPPARTRVEAFDRMRSDQPTATRSMMKIRVLPDRKCP